MNEIEDRHFAEVFHKKSRCLEKIVLISLIIVKTREIGQFSVLYLILLSEVFLKYGITRVNANSKIKNKHSSI